MTKAKCFLKYIDVEHLKCYRGVQRIGPLHFSAGPNGSGIVKFVVVDSLFTIVLIILFFCCWNRKVFQGCCQLCYGRKDGSTL